MDLLKDCKDLKDLPIRPSRYLAGFLTVLEQSVIRRDILWPSPHRK
jgi:hypothetical protein